jgi:iron complex transport system ATP-binding protein
LLPEAGDGEKQNVKIHSGLLDMSNDRIFLTSPIPLRTMSSGITGAGIGWHRSFVNRIVPPEYDCSDHKAEMAEYLHAQGFLPSETVGMMTAVPAETASFQLFTSGELSIFVLVSAGNTSRDLPRNINTWLFINGKISEEAFIQSAMTAAEAKVSVLQELDRSVNGAGGTVHGISTDSICIAATQQGPLISYAGTATPLGKLISEGIHTCTKEAILKYRGAQSVTKN